MPGPRTSDGPVLSRYERCCASVVCLCVCTVCNGEKGAGRRMREREREREREKTETERQRAQRFSTTIKAGPARLGVKVYQKKPNIVALSIHNIILMFLLIIPFLVVRALSSSLPLPSPRKNSNAN